MFSLAVPGLKISVAGSHGLAVGVASVLGRSMESERAMQDVDTINIGVQIQNGSMEPVARRQSLQWSVTIMGRWTFS